MPLLYDEFDKAGKVLLAGFLISVSVEIIQMFGCGATDIKDLITNTMVRVLDMEYLKSWKSLFPKNGLAYLE